MELRKYKELLSFENYFPSVMSRDTFHFLNRRLILDDLSTRQERWKRGRFAAARETFEEWNDTFGQCLQMNKVFINFTI